MTRDLATRTVTVLRQLSPGEVGADLLVSPSARAVPPAARAVPPADGRAKVCSTGHTQH